MPEALTLIERRIYNYLIDYLKRETYQPSVREIGSRFGIRSTKTVTEHLQSLQRKGYLDRTPSRSRALRILGLDLSPDTFTVPLYRNGREDDENVEARYDLDRAFACSADCFMVRVDDGDDELGIVSGDLILVDPAGDPHPGAVLVQARGSRIRVGRAPEDGEADSEDDGGRAGPTGAGTLGVARTVLRDLARAGGGRGRGH